MAKTLLNSVNEVMKRAGLIQGATGQLASLTDSGRQVWIDMIVQVVNEGMDELYSHMNVAKPNKVAENTITLATNDRDYALQTDLVTLKWPLQDRTNGNFITEYPGGYERMIVSEQVPANYTGLPREGAIRPTDGELYLDTLPTANENGLVYTYLYEKDTVLTLAADTVPFTDEVFRAMVPVWHQLFQRDRRVDFDEALFKVNLGRAARRFRQTPHRTNWHNRNPVVFEDHPPGI